jgi:hypothetical protein
MTGANFFMAIHLSRAFATIGEPILKVAPNLEKKAPESLDYSTFAALLKKQSHEHSTFI